MSRVFVPICLLASAAATGCVADEGDESFVILNNLAPEVDEMTGLVTFTPSEDGPFISTAAITTGDFALEVGSMVESRVTAAEGKESQRTIFIQGANISAQFSEVTLIAGPSVQRVGAPETIEYQVPFSASVRPNGGTAAAVYTLIPPEILATANAKIVAAGGVPVGGQAFITIDTTTTMFGDFYGDRIDSSSFNFPVTVFGFVPEPTP